MSDTVTLIIEFSVKPETDPTDVAEAVLDYLADGGDGIVPYPDMIDSIDFVEVKR